MVDKKKYQVKTPFTLVVDFKRKEFKRGEIIELDKETGKLYVGLGNLVEIKEEIKVKPAEVKKQEHKKAGK